MKPPTLDLDEPGTIRFTAERALRGQQFNRFGSSLRSEQNRQRFLADEEAYLAEFDVPDSIRALVAARDWTGLQKAGGHLQSVLKLAATVGQNLWDVGAHSVGCTADELRAATPRWVTGTPEGDF